MSGEFDDEQDRLEYRVKWDIGTKGATTAFYIQKPGGVKKQVEKLRAQHRQNIVVQARPVGEFFEPYDEADLAEVFGLKRLPPDWASMSVEDRRMMAVGHATKFPELDTAEKVAEFVDRCRAAIEAGDCLPGRP